MESLRLRTIPDHAWGHWLHRQQGSSRTCYAQVHQGSREDGLPHTEESLGSKNRHFPVMKLPESMINIQSTLRIVQKAWIAELKNNYSRKLF